MSFCVFISVFILKIFFKASYKSLCVTEDLYKKNIWNDEKTVNVISAACFHSHQKVQSRAISFFLGQDQKEEKGPGNDSDDDMDPEEKRQMEKNQEKLPSGSKSDLNM